MSIRLAFRWRILKSAVRDAWPVGLLLGGIGSAWLLGWYVTETFFNDATAADRVRYTGMALQVLGLLTVAVGLRQVRQMFKRPPLQMNLLGWFRRILAAFSAPKIVPAQGESVARATVVAEGEGVRTFRPEATVDERVALLEQNVNRLRDELDTKTGAIRQELSAVNKRLAQETQERQAEDRIIVLKIEELAVGGLHLEMVGLVWLLLGLLATSIPDEIASWLSWTLRL